MIENITHDQLRTFVAAADASSFSEAARRIHRAQSAVSQTIANLEIQLSVTLFDRAGRRPVLTDAGVILLFQARSVIHQLDLLKAQARGLSTGLEAELSVAVDVLFPMNLLTAAVKEFHAQFPHTPLRLYVEALGAVIQPVLDGVCSLGIIGTLPVVPHQCSEERLLVQRLLYVVSPQHPLGLIRHPISSRELEKHIQLVLTDRTPLSKGREFGVLSPNTWRLADLGAKHKFLKAGLGYGAMPRDVVEEDLENGSLVRLQIENAPLDDFSMTMSAVYPTAHPPGQAGRWLIERLKCTPPTSLFPGPQSA